MAAGKRNEEAGESFEDYRKRLAAEERAMREHRKGELVWCSSILVPHPGDKYKDVPEISRPLIKVRRQGTYVKPKKEVDIK